MTMLLPGNAPPGFNPARLVALMRAGVERCGLDLRGITVLTEAASGAYASTAILAALAGADRVHAVVKDTAYGSADAVRAEVEGLAAMAGVADRLLIFTGDPVELAADTDLVTNSGHVRPIDARMIERLPGHAVIALMYEVWEYRPADIDLAACAARGIPVVGVNERHPSVDVFSFLGPLAVQELHAAGIPVYGSRIALLCDNPFAPFIERGLTGMGAEVLTVDHPGALPSGCWDAVLVALRPRGAPVFGADDAARVRRQSPGTVLVQYWGDVDRNAVHEAGLPLWPPAAPRPGHMAVLLPAIGPDPIVRLQAGGLRAAEWVLRNGTASCLPGGIAELLPTPSAPSTPAGAETARA
ncbi:hypothetical protein [Azospirillum rugosum]|uniref:Uncharacterized protein n=1 Tax=Azospirillum rugosum TaxID=416170 RepID=A0ABS4SFU9_9PROT|nr:hypothetical protein [Azospirillum rugosum]MBP2291436.1 hypothetical protein [Azospirillum rugosum]MDQ0525224.1 hypothetical protein [Azospirillum rugosum]